MVERRKPVIRFAATVALVLVGAGVVAGAVAFSAGSVRVYVLEKRAGGDRVNLLVPARLVPLGLKFLPHRERERVGARLRPWLLALKAASLELARSADCQLLAIDSAQERVRVSKRGGSLVIDVDSASENVHLSVPLTVLARVAAEFENPAFIP
jgi:hypothetical protein